MAKWRIIISGYKSPKENMSIDCGLWRSVSLCKSAPVLRFYQWRPSAVSFGYNQSPENIVNIAFCKDRNIPVVRRPTGGSAIFHDIEITYSFCANVNDHASFVSPSGSYLSVCDGIIKGLGKMGLMVEVRGFSDGKEPSYTTRDCFSLSSRYDLVVDERKLVGSAQRRNRYAFLQHGSILIDINRELWDNIFVEKTDFSKITTLKELLRNDISTNILIQYIKQGFEDVFDVHFVESQPTPEEEKVDQWETQCIN